MSLNTSFSVRQAGPADWPAISSLLKANQLPLDGAQDHLSTFVVAHRAGEVLGVAGAEVRGDAALLRSVAVAPGLHHMGIGRTLVSTLIDQARRRQIRHIFLLTTTAAAYFPRFGFAPMDRQLVPEALKASAEFQGACPATATLMGLTLIESPDAPADLPVAVIGAGPVGLAAAARLIERGITPLILEAGASVGANLLDYGHVRLFSPWRYNIDQAMAEQLKATGWQAPADDQALPLAREIVEQVMQPFAALPEVAKALHLGVRVESISREGFDKVKTAGRDAAPFVIRGRRDGEPVQFRARAVIDATGTWSTPNPLGANGLPALGERDAADRIFYGIPDTLGAHRSRYAGKRTLVVGAGHSAANALLGLAELARTVPDTQLAWSVRTPTLARVFGGGSADALPARGQLGADLRRLRDQAGLEFFSGLRIDTIQRHGPTLTVEGLDAKGQRIRVQGIDEIICATGQRPDLGVASELRLKLDPWLESTEALGPLIDPNLHSCGTVRPHGHRELSHPEAGFYTVGVKSYGRAPTFLMATGFEQVRSVVAAIAGDWAAADRVELDLPETGVCSVGGPSAPSDGAAGGCCGTAPGPAATAASAATAVAAAVAAASSGCGSSCGTAPPKPAAAAAAGTAVRTGCCG
ncbi:MAG TPA: arsenic resistance N-acetyltransferase ArsN2 [Ideonella sp.]|uniref:arsenic resistance N-acetyltransferase ArsN2 n=1 Tax=Ideonella sp. TaxID=1929293 RepID=UPI002E2F634E|nr:arsenic resistance N-acetyltransferase ArsN2 [Ideonella sp.]HEX5683218.1 arsenic resistance N-acetyltransferase ArsN2 [Ideonella sp.]